MRITDVVIYCADYDPDAPNQPIFVKVDTDEGISGYGEAGVAYGNAKNGAIGQIRDFAELIIGEDPMRIEAIWNRFQKTTFWGLGGGTDIFSAISAIDIALWDIKGKKLGVPVHELLGGKVRDRVRCYASQVQFGWDPIGKPLKGIEAFGEAVRTAVDEGYTAVKIDPLQRDIDGKTVPRNAGLLAHDKKKLLEDRLRAVREAGGDDLQIILELHAKSDVTAAREIARIAEPFGISYIEEPCGPLNPGNMKRLKDSISIPVASGERIYTRFGFLPFLQNGSLDLIQPDLANCGGITEVKKVADMAEVFDVLVQAHVCGGPISEAAALQVEAVIPNFCIHEYHVGNLSDFTRSLATHDYSPVNGEITVPDLPGIGQEVPDAILQKCTKIIVK